MNRNAWVSRGQASYLTGVSTGAVGKWNVRGWVDATGTRRHLRTRRLANGRLQYHLGDILDAERDTHLSGKSRRGGGGGTDEWQLVAA